MKKIYFKFIIVLIITGCCKDCEILNTKKCYLYSSKKSNSLFNSYFLYNDSILSRYEFSNEYSKIITYKSDNSIEINNYFDIRYNVKRNYKKKNQDTILMFYNNNIISDSGFVHLVIKNDLIDSEILKIGEVKFKYNSDNTISEKIEPSIITKYEYYPNLDLINIDDNYYLITNHFKLKNKYNLIKKKTIIQNSNSVEYNYKYLFNSDGLVKEMIINNTDTTKYNYLCY